MRSHRHLNRNRRHAFTLVELLVVITIIGMLVALLLPAVNSAREAARQTTCTNNLRNYGEAIQSFVTAKDYFPGYRQKLPITGTGNTGAVSWQIALLPYLDRADLYQSIQSGVIGVSGKPLPYLELSVCPSDNTISGRSNPYTSYVANCGRLDKVTNTGVCLAENNNVLESIANGIFQDRILGNLKISLTDFKDGASTTLMLTENVDANYYNDAQIVTLSNNPSSDLSTGNTSGNIWERGAGFVWWDTSTSGGPPSNSSPPNSYTAAGINGARGDYDPGRIGWPSSSSDTSAPATPPATPNSNSNYVARPASNHPGLVCAVFAGGNTKSLKEEIDYTVYCMLMTPNGAKATTNSAGWQKNKPLDEGSF